MYQWALGAFAGDYVLSHVATLQCQFSYIDAKPALLFFRSVALYAVLLKHRPDVLFKINLAFGRWWKFFNINGKEVAGGQQES